MRIAVKPLLDELPVAGGVKVRAGRCPGGAAAGCCGVLQPADAKSPPPCAQVSLMGTPDFAYKVSTLGGNPYLVPGVEQLVSSFIRDNVMRPFTFPDGALRGNW